MAESHREEIAKLETLYANNPEGRVFTHLAEAYRKAGELQRAREIVEDGLRRHAEYSSAHVVLGRVLMDLGETDAARGAFERVLELDAHNLIALRSLGEIAVGAARPGEALPYYRELVSLDPADDRLRLTVARLEEQAAAAPPSEAAAPTGTAGEPEDEAPLESTIEAEEPIAFEAPADADPPAVEPEKPVAAASDTADEPEPPAALSWEEDVDVSLEALPGDLAAFDEGAAPSGVEDDAELESAAGDPESGDWVSATDWDRIARSADLASYGDDAQEASPEEAEFLGSADLEMTDPEMADEVPSDAGTPDEPDAGVLPWQDADDDAEVDSGADEGWTWPVETSDVDAAWAADAGADSRRRDEADDDIFVPGADVMTETMAELYTAQGFHARAAEVYRSLLRERPEDARLEAKLRDAEAAARPARPADAGPPEGKSEEEHERWLQGVESAWTGGSGTAMAEETPYAWAEQPGADEAEGGAPISSYFRELLAWRPSAAPSETDARADEVPVLEVELAGGDDQEFDMPLLLEEEVVEEESPVAPSPEPDGDGGRATSGPASASDVEEAFDEWFGPRAGGEPAPEAPVEESRDPDAPESDEDLEMFRSWLQSLKK